MSGKSELQIFNSIPPQVVVEQGVFVDINPITGVDDSTIEFVINGSQNEYIDLNDTLLYLKLNVINPDGSKLDAASSVAPTNYMMNALFSDVVLSMNNVIIEGVIHIIPTRQLLSLFLTLVKIQNVYNFYLWDTLMRMMNVESGSRSQSILSWLVHCVWISLTSQSILYLALTLDYYSREANMSLLFLLMLREMWSRSLKSILSRLHYKLDASKLLKRYN